MIDLVETEKKLALSYLDTVDTLNCNVLSWTLNLDKKGRNLKNSNRDYLHF